MAPITELPRYLRVLYPFESHFFEAPAGKLHFIDEGEGEAVLMFHGNPTWSFYYRNLVLSLKDRYRAIAVDHLGCGLSDRPTKFTYHLADHIDNASRLVEHLGLKRFHLVLHDWGGPVGLGLAQRHFDKVGKVVFLNTAAFFARPLPLPIQLSRSLGLGAFLTRGLNAFLLGSIFKCTQRSLTTETKHGYLWPYNTIKNREAIYRFVRDIPVNPAHPSYRTLKDIQDFLPHLAEKPLHAFWGMKDFVFDEAYLDAWREHYPLMPITRYEDAGHWVLEDAKGRIELDISAFLSDPMPNA